MRRLSLISIGVLVGQSALAMTNLVLVGNNSQQTKHFFGNQPVPWQANIVPLFILIIGIVHLFYPRVGWWLKYGWQFSGSVDPSALWLFFERVGGIFIIGMAVFVFCMINGFIQTFK